MTSLPAVAYRLDRRFTLPAVGIHFVAAGVFAAAAFLLWKPLGVVAVLLLLNAARVVAFPPVVAKTDADAVQLGGAMTVKRVQVAWADVEDVTVEDARLFFDRGNDRVLVFPLAYVGRRAQDLARDVRDRLNTANGYSKYDPTGKVSEPPFGALE
jgi:hypothetical protein